jgi:hypothetical protein
MRNYIILLGDTVLVSGKDEEETLTQWGVLTNPNEFKTKFPESYKKYHMEVKGKLTLARLIAEADEINTTSAS